MMVIFTLHKRKFDIPSRRFSRIRIFREQLRQKVRHIFVDFFVYMQERSNNRTQVLVMKVNKCQICTGIYLPYYLK